MITRKTLPLSVAAALTAASVFAASPPPPAIQACATSAQGAACSFQTPQGSVSGVCDMVENQMACIPGTSTAGPDDGQAAPDSGSSDAWFDAAEGLVHLPATEVSGLGVYDAVLALTGYNPLIFELRQAVPTAAGSSSAFFDPVGLMLSIPAIRVGAERFAVELKMSADSGVMRFAIASLAPVQAESGRYTIVDTNQSVLYDNDGNPLETLQSGDALFGQDANYLSVPFHYTDNNDGTVTDENTGLLWERAHHATRVSYYDAQAACEGLDLGGHSGWRLPTLKELFSLADFKGNQHSGRYYLDNDYFDLAPPETIDDDDQFSSHTVQMMGQTWSGTIYTGDHWNNPNIEAAFFFNFLDGHIKQAPTHGNDNFYRCVYGDEYGINDFSVNGDGTVTDRSSGLIWQQQDDGIGRNWQEALAYCEGLELAGQTDWRLPNIKELQSIVDYSRHDPAIDPAAFTLSDAEGWFWSGTTHGDATWSAAYICFGKCDSKDGVDTHGAGAQRADPKAGAPADYPGFGGAQDDDVRIDNYARCVRSGVAEVSFVSTDLASAGSVSGSSPADVPAEAPQEAIDACSGLAENAGCSFQDGDRVISGICGNLQGTLICKP